MPDEQGRQIRDGLNLKPGYVVARKGTSKESDKITKATGGRVSHVGLVTDVDAKNDKVTIIHSYPHEVRESAIQEITAEEFFSKDHHVAGTEEVRVPKEPGCCAKVVEVDTTDLMDERGLNYFCPRASIQSVVSLSWI